MKYSCDRQNFCSRPVSPELRAVATDGARREGSAAMFGAMLGDETDLCLYVWVYIWVSMGLYGSISMVKTTAWQNYGGLH